LLRCGLITGLVAQHDVMRLPFPMRSRPGTTQRQAALLHPPPVTSPSSDGSRGAFSLRCDLLIRDTTRANKNMFWLGCFRAQRSDHQPPAAGIPVPRLSTPWASTSQRCGFVAFRVPRADSCWSGLRSFQASSGKFSTFMDVFCPMPTAIASTAWPNYGAVWLHGWDGSDHSGTQRMCSDRSALVDFPMFTNAIALDCTPPLILVQKRALDARRVQVMLTKKDLRYSYPCAPRPCGTCDISAWDAFLPGSVFWASITVELGHFYWALEALAICRARGSVQRIKSTYLMGCFRDTSGSKLPADQRFTTLGNDNLARLGWDFLFGHWSGRRIHVPDLLEGYGRN